MRFQLKVSFSEKDQVKALAKDHGTRIQWDSANKAWFWEGDKLPAFLQAFLTESTAQRASDLFYLAQPTKTGYVVEHGPFKTKEELKTAAISVAKIASGWEEKTIASNLWFIQVSQNKEVGGWIGKRAARAANACSQSKDATLSALFKSLSE